MKALILFLLVVGMPAWSLTDAQLAEIRSNLMQQLKERGITEQDLQNKMSEIIADKNLLKEHLSKLNQPVTNVEGLSNEDLNEIQTYMDTLFGAKNITQQNVDALKEQVNQQIQAIEQE